jgi:signal transduction histidine kinase
MRIRKKLIVLHTAFSLVLAGILALALRPAIGEVIRQAEIHEAEVILQGVRRVDGNVVPGVEVRAGDAAAVGIDEETAARARAQAGTPVVMERPGEPARLVVFERTGAEAGEGVFRSVTTRQSGARGAVVRLYLLVTLALLAVYALVAAALEIFVLPRQVYEPIQRMLASDRAVQEGRREEEQIPESAIPADELGEIMRSRNRTIEAMRRQERDLAEAVSQLARTAEDLKRKNQLLEVARRNLEDADRLASLGMMSAGLSHEMNTPLAVLKGLAEKVERDRAGVTEEEAALMVRVVGRLERLSESLLDFARLRPARTSPVGLRSLVEEAWTLVRLDRDAAAVQFENRVDGGLVVECDADRMMQVMVNLLRNAVDAMAPSTVLHPAAPRGSNGEAAGLEGGAARPSAGDTARIVVEARRERRAAVPFVVVTIADNGPGIDPDVLSRLFEPFVSTRLDSKGSGLGLAVAAGIVRSHGGTLTARNLPEGGARFEVALPVRAGAGDGRTP